MAKTIIVTGAGAGLGRTLAQQFAGHGDTVILLGRTLAKVRSVADGLGAPALAVECDVSDPNSVRSAFEEIAKRHPRVDVLINNAAVYEPFYIAEASDEQILAPLLTNLAGPIYCARAVIPLMARGSHIINVSSESVLGEYPTLSIYQSTKAGLERFSESLARELAPSGIRVTVFRAGQMMDENTTSPFTPEAQAKLVKAHMDAGIDLYAKPISHFRSVAQIMRNVIDSPEDVQIGTVAVHARKP